MNTSNIQIYDNLKNIEDKKYDITTIFVTYNSALLDTLVSLKSIILQENIKHQIIVCDDGSKEFFNNEIKELFKKYNFNDYKIARKIKNEGTVKNVKTGLDLANGEYIKLLSPGDCLIDDNVLCDWLKEMTNHNKDWSFCKASYYIREDNDEIKIVRNVSYPIVTNVYKNNNTYKYRWNYLAETDISNGASVICKKDLYLKYFNLLIDRIILSEDLIYKIFMLKGEEVYFYNKTCILYQRKTNTKNTPTSPSSLIIKKDGQTLLKILEEIIDKDSNEECKLLEGFIRNEDLINNHNGIKQRAIRLVVYLVKNKSIVRLTNKTKNIEDILSL